MSCPALLVCLGGNSDRTSIVVGIRDGQAFGQMIENRQQARSAVKLSRQRHQPRWAPRNSRELLRVRVVCVKPPTNPFGSARGQAICAGRSEPVRTP